jgi:predicted metal-dependent enzyme (double-stranded beta helix superfamily)
MSSHSDIPGEITSLCERCADAFSKTDEVDAMIEFVRAELPKLQREKRLFADLLLGAIERAPFPDLGRATMFDNELLLCHDPVHRFSLRAFLWEPGHYTAVHDHGSWGVIGPVTGKLEVVNYRREDDGSDASRAVLVEEEMLTLEPGETTFTLPLDVGIHEVGNPTDETILSLSLYGKPLPRGYIYGFDVAEGRAYRIISPTTNKRLLIAQALAGLDAEAGEKALKKMAENPVEIFRERSPANGAPQAEPPPNSTG